MQVHEMVDGVRCESDAGVKGHAYWEPGVKTSVRFLNHYHPPGHDHIKNGALIPLYRLRRIQG
ncbi:MAG: hypothetical protein IIC27_02945 [Chloroflexi bacterium]|nr:hypothetical protein [Chloroflexota bacterium]